LNEWLKKGIEYELEVTDDVVPPFSPGYIGAPPSFTIYNNWAVRMERISEAEVVGAMQAFAANVMSLGEHQRSEWRKLVLDNSKNLEKDLRSMDMDDLAMRKAVDARNKKLVLLSNQRGIFICTGGGCCCCCMRVRASLSLSMCVFVCVCVCVCVVHTNVAHLVRVSCLVPS
jgi:hypothetical protein